MSFDPFLTVFQGQIIALGLERGLPDDARSGAALPLRGPVHALVGRRPFALQGVCPTPPFLIGIAFGIAGLLQIAEDRCGLFHYIWRSWRYDYLHRLLLHHDARHRARHTGLYRHKRHFWPDAQLRLGKHHLRQRHRGV